MASPVANSLTWPTVLKPYPLSPDYRKLAQSIFMRWGVGFASSIQSIPTRGPCRLPPGRRQRSAAVEGSAALSAGRHTVEFEFKYDGQGLGKGGTGTIKVDGVETGRGTFPHTIPFALESSETFDVGSDTGTGVDDEDYQTPFAFDGKLDKLTLTLERPKLTPEDKKMLDEGMKGAADAK
jgi:hypothetical protein